MNKSLLFIPFLLALSCIQISAQDIFLANQQLDRTTPSNWNATSIGSFESPIEMGDITFHPNGNLYGIDQVLNSLYIINPFNANLTSIAGIPFTVNGMTSSKEGKIYMAFDHLLTLNPVTLAITDLGKLNYECAGDLVFWHGDLYMSSRFDGLIKVNIQHPDMSVPYMPLPSGHFFVGLATDWNCVGPETTVFAFSPDGTVLKLNMAQRSFEFIAGVSLPTLGAASRYDYEESEPPLSVIDTIETVSPDCGQTNGLILIILRVPDPNILFSLDSLHWQHSGEFLNLTAGIYQIYLQNSCQTEPIQIILPDTESPDIPAIQVEPAHCTNANGRVELLDLASNIVFRLNQSEWNTTSNFIDSLASGSYLLTVRNTQGCSNFQWIYVPVQNAVTTLFLQSSGVSCQDAPIKVFVADSLAQSIIYSWSINGARVEGAVGDSLQITISEPGIYTIGVQGTDINGCTYIGLVTDILSTCFAIPNAFSPNGDGVNDTFGPVTFGLDKPFEMTIFNRWGQLVFQNDVLHPYWDGRFGSEAAVSDVYAYSIKTNGKQYQGAVTLLR